MNEDISRIHSLIKEMKPGGWFREDKSVVELKKIGSTAVVNELIKVINGEIPIGLLKHSLYLLGEIGDSNAADAVSKYIKNNLFDTLGKPNHNDLSYAIDALISIGISSPNVIEALTEVINNHPGYVSQTRQPAAYALGKLGDKTSIKTLVNILENRDEGRHTIESAVYSLKKLGWEPDNSEAGIVFYVWQGNTDKCIEIGEPAVDTLINIVEDRGRVGLHSQMFDAIAVAAEALGEIGSDRAIKPIISALSYYPHDLPPGNTPENYTPTITDALKKLTKQELGGQFLSWKIWYTKNIGEWK